MPGVQGRAPAWSATCRRRAARPGWRSGLTGGSTSPTSTRSWCCGPMPAAPPTAELYASGVPGANGIAWDERGDLWVSDGGQAQGRVWRIGRDRAPVEMFRVQPMANAAGVGRQARRPPAGLAAGDRGQRARVRPRRDALRRRHRARRDLARLPRPARAGPEPHRLRHDVPPRTRCAWTTSSSSTRSSRAPTGSCSTSEDNIYVAANERNALGVVTQRGEVFERHAQPGRGSGPAKRGSARVPDEPGARRPEGLRDELRRRAARQRARHARRGPEDQLRRVLRRRKPRPRSLELAAGHQDPADLQAVVQDHDVRRGAGHQAAQIRASGDPGGDLGGGPQRVGERRRRAPCRLRTASSIVSALPASWPSGPRTTPPARLDRSPAEHERAVAHARRRAPRRSPARSARAAAFQATSTVSPATWCRSTISCTTTSGRASAAKAMPGSRGVGGRIALNRWVTVRTPRSNPSVRLGGGRVGVAGGDGDRRARRARRSARTRPEARARASSAATGAGRQQPPQQRQVRRRGGARVVRARAQRREERALEMGAQDARADALDRHRAQRGQQRLLRRAVTNVGWKAVVPAASSASPARAYPSRSAVIRSTPANPFTCRSTKPGAAMPRPGPDSPTARTTPSSTATSPGSDLAPRSAPPRRPAASTPLHLTECVQVSQGLFARLGGRYPRPCPGPRSSSSSSLLAALAPVVVVRALRDAST